MACKILSSKEIIKLIEFNRWDDIFDHLTNELIKEPNKLIINGNNIFHMACIRGQTDFIEKIFKLRHKLSDPPNKNSKIDINPDLPNADGFPGIHLYYKYGGRSKSLLQITSTCYLDRSYGSLLNYLVDKIELLEVYIDSTVEKACLINIELVESPDNRPTRNIYYLLIKQIKKTDQYDVKDRYLKIIKLLMLNLSNKKAVHYAIAMDSKIVFEYLVREGLFDPMVRTANGETPLIVAVYNNKIEFVKRILEEYENMFDDPSYDLPNIRKYISMYRAFTDGRSINICIKDRFLDILQILIKHLKRWRAKKKDDTYHTETDEYNATYLHNLLMSTDIDISSIETHDILTYFIKYTDLNQESYYGYTPAHLIFAQGLWKLQHAEKELDGRKIDLLKVDADGKNVYSYIKKNNQREFMNLTSRMKLLPNTRGSSQIETEINELDKIIEVVSRDSLKERKDYGLFNPSQLNYIIFMTYLKNKHSNLFIPQRIYDTSKKRDDQYLMELTSYPISEVQDIVNTYQIIDHVRYYSYAPHLISWHDSKLHVIHPELVDILKTQDKADPDYKRRFVMIKLLIILTENSNHANCLIYDRKTREAWRFESYGLSDMVKDGNVMDMTLKSILETIYGKITYNSPSDYLSNIKFQLADDEDNSIVRNLGDPGGYCLAWCIWFVDVICSNLIDVKDETMTVDYLMRNYITRNRLENIMFENTDNKSLKSNIYLEYIRQYGHHLDTEKNQIMKGLGMTRDTYYKVMLNSTDLKKIDQYVRVKTVQYD